MMQRTVLAALRPLAILHTMISAFTVPNPSFYTTGFHLAVYVMYSCQLSKLFLNLPFILEIGTHGLL